MNLSYTQAKEQDWKLVRDLEKEAAFISPRFFLAYNTGKEVKDYINKSKVFLISRERESLLVQFPIISRGQVMFTLKV